MKPLKKSLKKSFRTVFLASAFACWTVAAQQAVRPQADLEDGMAGFLFRLETSKGMAADPPTLASAVPNWKAGDTIPLGRRTLRVVRIRESKAELSLWSEWWPIRAIHH